MSMIPETQDVNFHELGAASNTAQADERKKSAASSPLLDLPAEIRSLIWDLALGSNLVCIEESYTNTDIFAGVNRSEPGKLQWLATFIDENMTPAGSDVLYNSYDAFISESSSFCKRPIQDLQGRDGLALLRVCKLIYKEAKGRTWSNDRFHFLQAQDLLRFCDKGFLDPVDLAHIRSLEIVSRIFLYAEVLPVSVSQMHTMQRRKLAFGRVHPLDFHDILTDNGDELASLTGLRELTIGFKIECPIRDILDEGPEYTGHSGQEIADRVWEEYGHHQIPKVWGHLKTAVVKFNESDCKKGHGVDFLGHHPYCPEHGQYGPGVRRQMDEIAKGLEARIRMSCRGSRYRC